MSNRQSTYLKQQNGKRTVKKLNDTVRDTLRYERFAAGSGDKAQLRTIAEQAYGEWQFRNQHRVSNLSDRLRCKY
jgi:hypothetical protein